MALVVLAGWEVRRKEPLIDLRYFRSPSFTAAVLIGICAFADLGGFLFLTSIYLQDVRGSSVLQAGLYLLPTAAAMAVCPSVATWLTSKTGGARLPLLIGGLALMFSTNMMSRLTGSSSDTCLLVTFGLFGVGMGMVNSQISVAAVAGMPTGQAGLASGIASASRLLGQALGVAVAGSLLTARGPRTATRHVRPGESFRLVHPVLVRVRGRRLRVRDKAPASPARRRSGASPEHAAPQAVHAASAAERPATGGVLDAVKATGLRSGCRVS